MTSYSQIYQRSISDREEFFLEQVDHIDWNRKPTQALDDTSAPLYRWYPGGQLNTCFNAVDRHVLADRGDQPALIHDSPVTGEVTTLTYSDLLAHVEALAGGLRELGVAKGDRVVLYMPMIPQAVISMLACARLGAVHSVVFGGFAPAELAARIDDAQPTVVITASCGIEPNRVIEYKPLLNQALALAEHRPVACIVVQRPQCAAQLDTELDHEWEAVLNRGREKPAGCVMVESSDPLYILYTSGTTGRPKGIVRDNGGHAVAMAWSMKNIYDIAVGDVWWAASDVGWVVGHSYIVYAPLIVGATSVLYEGKPVGTPDAGAFGRVIAQHSVKALFAAPTAVRAIRQKDPSGEQLSRHDTSSLRHLFLAGERLDPDTYEWAGRIFDVPIIDNWWQTETGWPIAANLRGLDPSPTKPGSPSVPVPGFDVRILDANGNEVKARTEGMIVIKLPLPPGTMQTVWRDERRFLSSYLEVFDGYYLTGDGGYFDDDGYLYVMGRTDDIINVAGHRLSTGAMEAVLASHPDVAECAVIGVADTVKGQLPRGFAVLESGSLRNPQEVEAELVARVREHIGAVAALKDVRIVDALPKTRSGKILRKTMREIADGAEVHVPSTIDDASTLEQLIPHLRMITTDHAAAHLE